MGLITNCIVVEKEYSLTKKELLDTRNEEESGERKGIRALEVFMIKFPAYN
jgi:hypothetical protein